MESNLCEELELPSAGHFHLAPVEQAQGMVDAYSQGDGAVKALMTSLM